MNSLVILGAGGFAREVLWAVNEVNMVRPCWDVLGFIEDEEYGRHNEMVCGCRILGGFDWFEHVDGSVDVVCGVSSPFWRKNMCEKVKSKDVEFATIVSPDVKKSEYVSIGEGSIICSGNIITTQVCIGRHVVVNLDCTIGHDSIIEDYCNISPGVHVSGNVHIGKGVEIGTGANIIPHVKIGESSVIGAGATVIRDIPPNVVAVGTPAKVIQDHYVPG